MSTPLDAVFSRCRPVRLWNGSSSASRRRRATTRCWKGCRLAGGGRREAGRGKREEGRGVAGRLRAIVAGGILLGPARLFAQQAPTTPSHPEVVNLTLKGVKSVKQSELLSNIYTTASYCNSFILKPFCWISHAKYFFTKKYLDRQELGRDLLRIRVFYWKRGYREAEVDTAVVNRGHNKVGVTFFIKEGPPTLVSDIIVNQPTPTLLSQRALYESNLFRRAAIEPRPPIDIATPDSAKVVVVTVQESPSREARVSAGFNTIDFFQVESRVTDYNFFGSARRLDVQGV